MEQLTGGELADKLDHQKALNRFNGKMPRARPNFDKREHDQKFGDLVRQAFTASPQVHRSEAYKRAESLFK